MTFLIVKTLLKYFKIGSEVSILSFSLAVAFGNLKCLGMVLIIGQNKEKLSKKEIKKITIE